MSSMFYLRYALRTLRRGGQRTVLALICIAFGVMSLTGMQILARSIDTALVIDPRADIDGDAVLYNPDSGLNAIQLAHIEALRREGTLAAYSLHARTVWGILKEPDSATIIQYATLHGVDPATYPQVGVVELDAPAGRQLADVLEQPGALVLTTVMAQRYGLELGDRLLYAPEDGQTPQALEIAGIASRMPNNSGTAMLYSLSANPQLALELEAAVAWGTNGPQVEQLEAAGFTVLTAARVADSKRLDIFKTMLTGAGVLGLIVGGIGVANTMAVVLARRKREIAMLKTLGYRQGHLLLLFGIETALLGALGALLGVLGAVAIAARLTTMLANSGTLMIATVLEAPMLIGGLLSGIMTTLIFGTVAIVRSSIVRPAVMLRDLPEQQSRATRNATIGLYAVLALLFTAQASVLMESALNGVGVVLLAIVGFALFGLIFSLLIKGLMRLPLPGYLLRTAQRNLGRQRRRAVFALIAISVGVFSIGFSTMVVLSAQERSMKFLDSTAPETLWIYARPDRAAAVDAALAQANVTSMLLPVWRVPITLHMTVPSDIPNELTTTLEAASAQPDELSITTGTPLTTANDVLLPDWMLEAYQLAPGDQLLATGSAATVTATISGFYTPLAERIGGGAQASPELITRLSGGQGTLIYTIKLPENQLSATTEQLNRALPDALVYNQLELSAANNAEINSLLAFVISIAGLAFVAGGVLVANAVGLAMVERRRELGLFKAIGYTSSTVRRLVLLENGLVGMLASVCGMLAVYITIKLLNATQPYARLVMYSGPTIGLIGLSVALTVLCAALVAWRPTGVRPLVVLREE